MSDELAVIKIVSSKLDELQIPYMISGSIATNYYTIPRMTRDIDIVVEMTLGNIEKFVALFSPDFYVDKDMITEEVKRGRMFNLIHNDSVVKIDFIVKTPTEYAELAFSRRQKITIDSSDAPIWIIAIEDLILAKLNWAKDSHSEMQLNDVRNLMKSSKNIDFTYIQRWVKRLDLVSIFGEVTI